MEEKGDYRRLVRNLRRANEEKKELFELCKKVFQNDKTIYQYPNNCSKDEMELAENREGQLPKGKGKRWLTPAELVEIFVRKHFPDKLEELYKINYNIKEKMKIC